MSDYVTYDLEPLSLAEAIFMRPKMYTVTGSLAEILALLEGFDTAVRRAAKCTDESPSDSLEWIRGECGLERYDTSPREQIGRIMDKYGSEENAVEALLAFAKERRQRLKG